MLAHAGSLRLDGSPSQPAGIWKGKYTAILEKAPVAIDGALCSRARRLGGLYAIQTGTALLSRDEADLWRPAMGADLEEVVAKSFPTQRAKKGQRKH